jgi:hypothetical protein
VQVDLTDEEKTPEPIVRKWQRKAAEKNEEDEGEGVGDGEPQTIFDGLPEAQTTSA